MMQLSFEQIKAQLQHLNAQKKWYRALSQRAAVCMILADRPGLGCSLLMIQRAERAGDPWSGQMAFPGGKFDSNDNHITHTALRETEEELGLPHHHLRRIGRLSDILARPYRLEQKPMVVSPLVFEPLEELHFSPNAEVADVLWVPLALFMDTQRREKISWKKNGIQMDLPCYYYQGKKIWGMSLMMIDEFVAMAIRNDSQQ